MLPETPAVLTLRRAVRGWLSAHADGADSVVAVALSGGPDSLALTAATVVEAAGVSALVVDHGLQPGSAAVAESAAAAALSLGCGDAEVLRVRVGVDGGLEAAARRARYAALDSARGQRPVLFGHTLDDQAETVLLGLARGSGGRSLRGMAAYDPPWGRPLLAVRRAQTEQLCADLGLRPHRDPHNDVSDFTRVRLRREALPLLEDVLAGGVAEALARTAAQLREDGEVLDALGDDLARAAASENTLLTAVLADAPAALRRRAVRSWLHAAGASGLTDAHLRAVDALIVTWRGQGPVAIPGGLNGQARLVVSRVHGRLTLGLMGLRGS